MKKGETVTGYVERVDFPNRGMVRVEDRESGEVGRFRVTNVIPGQTVKIRIQKKGKPINTAGDTQSGSPKSGKAALVSVEKRSDIESNDTPCSMIGLCGGCQYMTVRYDEQLRLKEDQIRRLLSPVIGEDEYDRVYEGILKSPLQDSYRNKMELSFGNSEKDGPLTLGMHKRGSFYDIVDATGCLLMDPDMRQVAKATLEYFKNAGTPFVNKKTGEGYLRHLLIRRGYSTGELLVDLVTSTSMSTDTEQSLLEGWKDALLALNEKWAASSAAEDRSSAAEEGPSDSKDGSSDAEYKHVKSSIAGILHTRCDRIADVIEDQGTDILYGADHFDDELLGLKFMITPFSFFQTNTFGAAVLYSVARDYILGGSDHGSLMTDGGADISDEKASGRKMTDKLTGKTVYDLYSGTGTIAQIISPAAKQVIGVEIVEEAVEAAKENAARNGITNCEFSAGDVLKVLDDIKNKPDMIILDPPRDGIHPKALPKLIAYGVDEILYISCKATSLERDLPAFLDAGYRVSRLCCVDMFPNTTGVETVCLLKQIAFD